MTRLSSRAASSGTNGQVLELSSQTEREQHRRARQPNSVSNTNNGASQAESSGTNRRNSVTPEPTVEERDVTGRPTDATDINDAVSRPVTGSPQRRVLEPISERGEVNGVRVTLDEDSDGALRPKLSGPPSTQDVQRLLMHILANAGGQFIGNVSDDAGRQHALVKPDGALVVIKLQRHGAMVVNQNQGNVSLANRVQSTAPLSLSPSAVGCDGMQVALPDSFLEERMTGCVALPSTEAPEGELHRLHDDTLYRFDAALDEWVDAGMSSAKDLARHTGGQVTLVHDDRTLVYLGGNRQEKAFDNKIVCASVDEHGEEAVLTVDDNKHQQLWLSDRNGATQRLNCGRTLVALHRQDNWLMAADDAGRLLIDEVPTTASDEIFPARSQESAATRLSALAEQHIRSVIGDSYYRVEALLPAATQGVHAVVIDAKDQRRAIHLDLATPSDSSPLSWDLSNAQVLEKTSGLPSIKDVDPMQQIKLSLGGSLALHEGKLYYQQPQGRSWQSTELKADQLWITRDGQPWIHHDGEYNAIKHERNKLLHNANSLSRFHARKVVQKGDALPGMNKEQANDKKAVVPIDSNAYFTLEQSGDICLRQGEAKNEREPRRTSVLSGAELAQQMRHVEVNQDSGLLNVNIDASPFSVDGINTGSDDSGATVQDLAIGPDNRLFMLTADNRLFSCSKQGWQQGKLADLRKERLPDAESLDPQDAASLHARDVDTLLFKSGNKVFSYQGKEWGEEVAEDQPHSSTNKPSVLKDNFLPQMSKVHRLTKNGVGWHAEASVGGINLKNDRNRTSYSARMRAHIAQPIQAFPTSLRRIPHVWNGRQGAKGLYEEIFKQVGEFSRLSVEDNSQVASERTGLVERAKTSLNQLDNPEWGEQLTDFIEQVGLKTAHHARLLDEIYGGGQAPTASKFEKAKDLVHFRQNTDGGPLIAKLVSVLNAYPTGVGEIPATVTSDDNSRDGIYQSAVVPLREIAERGVSIDFPSSKVVRERYGKGNLLKGVLMVDAANIKRLHEIIEQLEGVNPGDSAQSARLEKEFQRCKNDWEDNSLVQIVSIGMTSTLQYEANYEAAKSMITASSNPSHGINMHLRAALGVEKHDNETLKKNLKQLLIGELPQDASVKLNRGYAGTATLLFSPDVITGMPLTLGVGLRIGLQRGNTLTFKKMDEYNTEVTFEREGNASANILVYSGLFEKVEIPTGLMNLTLWGGLGTALNGTGKRTNSFSVTLGSDEVAGFVDLLVDGRAAPDTGLQRNFGKQRAGRGQLSLSDLAFKGKNHSASQAANGAFTINVYTAAVALTSIPLANCPVGKGDNQTVFEPTWRIGPRFALSANVLSLRKKTTTKVGGDSSTQKRSDNDPEFFRQASVMADLVAPLGVIIESPVGTSLAYAGPSLISASATFDKSKDKSFSYEIKGVGPIEQKDIDDAIAKLKAAFYDDQSVKAQIEEIAQSTAESTEAQEGDAENLASSDSFEKQLNKLTECFGDKSLVASGFRTEKTVPDAAKREALKNLDRLVAQYAALNKGTPMIGDSGYSVEDMSPNALPSQEDVKDFQYKLIGALTSSDPQLRRTIRNLQQADAGITVSSQLELTSDGRAIVDKLHQYYGREAAEAYMYYAYTGKDQSLKKVSQQLHEKYGVGGSANFICEALGKNVPYVRVKSLAFDKSFDSATKLQMPNMLIAANNSSSISVSYPLGKIDFDYSETSGSPSGYTLSGSLSEEQAAGLAAAMENLRADEGLALR